MPRRLHPYRKGIELDPQNAHIYNCLARALAHQGRFAESLAAFKRGHELGSKQPGWAFPSAEWVREAEANAKIEAKLPAFVKGEFQPADNKDRMALIAVCRAKKLYHTGSGLYIEAFAADPMLAADLKAEHRYNAACDSTLAASGRGKDAANLDDAERTRLRRQAIEWLRADLKSHMKQLETGALADRAEVLRTMRRWQKDSDLASIRDAESLAELSADEQKGFTQLWADVAVLVHKGEEKSK